MSEKKDITTRQDIEKLIKAFYEKMLDDMILGFIFTEIAKVDLEKHLPVICDFWETVILAVPKYKRGPEVINVHMDLNEKVPLKKGHFTRWLYLFHTTIDELFEGENATKTKERASLIADSMLKRLNNKKQIKVVSE